MRRSPNAGSAPGAEGGTRTRAAWNHEATALYRRGRVPDGWAAEPVQPLQRAIGKRIGISQVQVSRIPRSSVQRLGNCVEQSQA